MECKLVIGKSAVKTLTRRVSASFRKSTIAWVCELASIKGYRVIFIFIKILVETTTCSNNRLAHDQVVLLETTANLWACWCNTNVFSVFSSFELGGIAKHVSLGLALAFIWKYFWHFFQITISFSLALAQKSVVLI